MLHIRLAATLVFAAVTGPCLASSPPAPAPAPPPIVVSAPANVGYPSWWDGDCDANHWDAAAAQMGWTGVGAHRLGAIYLGVPVCGPSPIRNGAPDVRWLKSGWGHLEWECTELAFRFMTQVYGVTPYSANGNAVVRNYRPQYGGGLQTVNNGTVGWGPLPGDIMSFDSSTSPQGHVAVVVSSVVYPNGDGSVVLMSQNDTADGWRTLKMTAWTVKGFGSDVPTGWLHDPAGRGAPPGA